MILFPLFTDYNLSLQDDKVLNELADKLGDKMDASTRRGVRADLEEVLKANASVR